MDLPWGDERSKQFITNVGLITNTGKYGQNVMACEWTHQISYEPGMIAVCIAEGSASKENIKETKEFGVNLCADDQAALSSIAGRNSGRNVDKIKVLEELGFSFYAGKSIKPLMIEGAVINVECKLVNVLEVGSHTMLIGEVVEAKKNEGKKPLCYHQGKYGHVVWDIPGATDEEKKKIKALIEKYKK